jgi:hypothetical protein
LRVAGPINPQNHTLMKTRTLSLTLLIATLGAAPAFGQITTPTSGTRELTLGASGAADDEFNDSSGGVQFSYGYYTSDRWMWSLRQSINYVNPENAGSSWDGSTRVAGDYHFGTGKWRPFLGANVGYVYGENTNDSWAAGLEGGVKYYVRDGTFVFGLVEYAWLFDSPDDVEDTFDDGRFVWGVGVGFNF